MGIFTFLLSYKIWNAFIGNNVWNKHKSSEMHVYDDDDDGS